jgi:hypothetical protein
MDGEPALTTQQQALSAVAMLIAKLQANAALLTKCDQYYTGTQPISFLAPEVRAQVGNRLTPLVINWPRVIVDSVQRRTYPEGFAIGRGADADDELRRIWQENDLDEWSQLGRIDALVHGRSFLSVWANDEDARTPRIAVESPHETVVGFVPGTRQVRAALKLWADGEVVYATTYFADSVWMLSARAAVAGALPAEWRVDSVVEHNLGAVPVVPLVNRPRTLGLDGESELSDVMPVADAINKLASDMLLTSEFSAMPRRWATGIEIPSGPNRERLQAEAAAYWDGATKGKTWLAGQGVQFGQFPEATLENFVSGIKLLTAQLAAIGGLPPDDLGLSTTNPASAEARRAADTTLILRAKEKIASWSGSYERTMRLAVAVRDGIPLSQVPAEFRSMETIWRDPETPTVAQSADAAVKLLGAGVIDEVQAQIDVGLSTTQRDAIAERKQGALLGPVSAQLAEAQRLQTEQGLSQQAAFAAVGLLQAASAIAQQP